MNKYRKADSDILLDFIQTKGKLSNELSSILTDVYCSCELTQQGLWQESLGNKESHIMFTNQESRPTHRPV